MSTVDNAHGKAQYSSDLRVLLTRAEHKNNALIDVLNTHHIPAVSHPVLQLSGTLNEEKLKCSTLLACNVLIAISEPAVTYLRQSVETCHDRNFGQQLLAHLRSIPLLAVGQATAKTLEQWLGVSVSYPSIATSEGLLTEPVANGILQLPAISHRNIMILRGNGGRELLATELTARHAHVNYLESYQRQPRKDVNNIWLDQWKSQQINCIVATSVEQFTAIWQLAHVPEQKAWLQRCTWIVASERIQQRLLEQNIHTVINAFGASNKAVLTQILALAS